jgi:hypothetical protein
MGESKQLINRGAHVHCVSESGINCGAELRVKLFNPELFFSSEFQVF